MIKAVIFDYFGVICSDEYWQFVKEDKNVDNAAFHKLANEVNLGHIRWRDFINQVASQTGTSPEEVAQLYQKQRIQPTIVAYITQLHERFKTALLTNAHYEFLEPVIETAKLDKLFDAIIISSKVGVIKPSRQIFEYALSHLGVAADEAIMVDDISRHLEGAKAVGLHTVLYQDFPQMKQEIEKILTANS